MFKRIVAASIVLILCMWMASSAFVVGAEPTMAANTRAAEPITIETRFTFPETLSVSDLPVVALAGLASTDRRFPDIISLVWTEQESAWVPTWELQLHSRFDLLPTQTVQRVQENRLLRTQFVNIANIVPESGHTYTTVLSYDPHTGGLAIKLDDLTAGKTVYQKQFVLPTINQAYYATAGSIQPGPEDVDDRFVLFADRLTYASFIPQAVSWGIVLVRDGNPETTTVSRLDRTHSEGIGLRLQTPVKVAGTFRFFINQGQLHQQVAQVEAPMGDVFVPLSIDALPLGPSTLTLEYYADERRWFSESQQFTVGRMSARFSALRFDQKAANIQGILLLEGDGSFPETTVNVNATFSQMIWDAKANRFNVKPWKQVPVFRGTVTLSANPLQVPMQIPTPDTKPGLWQVAYTISTENEITFVTEGTEQLVGTYRAPVTDAGSSFTIAVLPDTQYYTLKGSQGGHPDMFVRQTQWIAENAEKESIALMLHLGDITQMNATDHWEVAQRSISLLDGVVPYVLSIGNHDLGDQKGESRETRFNHYFPLSKYASLPSFGGVYQTSHLENSYHQFHLGGQDYLVISLEFLPRDPVLEWANQVVAAHPNHKVIVITHTYTARDGSTRSAYGATPEKGILAWGSVSTGYEIWSKFVQKHPNILMVLSGHIHHDSAPRQVQVGMKGNRVYEMLFDYQLGPHGGDGWLALLRFFPKEDRIGVVVYSPTRGEINYDNTDDFTVPFCIDLARGEYSVMDGVCAVDILE